MLRAIALVLGLLVVCLYLAFFLSLNMDPYSFRVFRTGQDYIEQPLPVGLLLVLGIVIGAVVMALALWAPWNTLKAAEAQQRALVQKAKQKLRAQDDKIKGLTQEVEELTARMGAEQLGASEDLGSEAQAALADVADAGKETAADEPEGEAPPEDDPEVI